MDSWENPARESQTRILEKYVFALYWLSRSAVLCNPVLCASRTMHTCPPLELARSLARARSGVVCPGRAMVILVKPRHISPGPWSRYKRTWSDYSPGLAFPIVLSRCEFYCGNFAQSNLPKQKYSISFYARATVNMISVDFGNAWKSCDCVANFLKTKIKSLDYFFGLHSSERDRSENQ